jgi:hypothetical protein
MNTKLSIKSNDDSVSTSVTELIAYIILFFIFAGFIKLGIVVVISWAAKYGIKWAGYVPNLSYWEICAVGIACKSVRSMIFGFKK